MLPEDSIGTACSRDRCRRRKWAAVRFLHGIVHQPPYRYHSIACALEATPGRAYTISKAAFVTTMMAKYQFDRKLRMDTQLRSLYVCFEGAGADAVDYRDIVACMECMRRFKEVRDNPRKLFRDLVLSYADETRTVVRRSDALRVARMGGIDESGVMQTSSRLDKYLEQEAGSRGLKPTFRDVPVTFLMEVIESNPSVLDAFRTQLWQRIPEAWRVGMLQAVESAGFKKAGSGALAMKQRRAARWYAKTLSRKVMVGWKIFRNRAKQIKAHRVKIEVVLGRQVVHAWRTFASLEVVKRKGRVVAAQRGRLVILRRFFACVVKYAKVNKRLAAMTSAHSKQGKLVVAGVGLINGVLRTRSMRLALREWCQAASLMNAWEFAVDLSKERLCRRAFSGFRDIVKAAVEARRADDEAEMRAAAIAESIQEAERERALLVEAAEARAKLQKAEAKTALMAKRAADHLASIQAARAESTARDAEIAMRQRTARRRRVYEDKVRIQNDFNAHWEVKLKEIIEGDMEETKTWLDTDSEAPFRIEKELHILKRNFFAAPSPETADLERALKDPANAIFAHMANLLYNENKSLKSFFDQFDKEGDGYLAHGEFKGMVSSLNIMLSGEQIRSVIRAIDLDGGGYIDFPEFEAAVKRHEDVCGAAGSAWKMYISPIHAVMVLHNVETNEEVWDYKATDADLLRVVKDNIVGLGGITAKARAAKEREQEWEKLLRDRAATTIQRGYHAWAARKKRDLLRWKGDVEKAREKNRGENLSATKIQCWWRVLRAKWLALCLVRITVEVLWDPGSNQKYYFNHGVGQATWELPSMLRRWRGESARLPDVPEWVLIARVFGQSYFYNTHSQTRQDDKPAGYIQCLSCQTQLASRRCTVEQRDLCFLCYRQEHLEGDQRCWHKWVASKAYACRMCAVHDATVVCTSCNAPPPDKAKSGNTTSRSAEEERGLVLCDSCWDRVHKEADVQHHTMITVEQWAARDRRLEAGREMVVLEGNFTDEKAADQVASWDGAEWGSGGGSDGAAHYAGAEQYGLDPYI